jgi:hypothetical protein
MSVEFNNCGVAVSGACRIIDTRKPDKEDDYSEPHIRVAFYEDAGKWFYGIDVNGGLSGYCNPATKRDTLASYEDCREAVVRELRTARLRKKWDLKEKAVLLKLVRRFEELSGYGGLF